MKLLPKLMLLALPVLAAACGGGGSDGKTCSTDENLNKSCTFASPAIPEGIWYGATTSGQAAQTIVLETGAYYSVYTNGTALSYLTQGQFTGLNGAISDGSSVAVSSSGAIIAANLTGTFTAKNKLAANTQVQTTPTITTLEFNGTYSTVYDTPLAISDVIGAWTTPGSTTATLTFNADGSVTGTQNTCTFTGSFKPRATGKHLLDGTLNFTSASCSTGSGVSMPVEATVVNGQLTIVGVTPQRSKAFYMAAAR
jgi:hypothetical protein